MGALNVATLFALPVGNPTIIGSIAAHLLDRLFYYDLRNA